MYIFSKRPLFCASMLFIAALVAGYFLSGRLTLISVIASVILCVAIILLFILLSVFKKLPVYHSIYWGLSVFAITAALVISYCSFTIRMSSYRELYGENITIDAYAVEVKSESSSFAKYEIEVLSVNGKKDKHKAILTCEYDSGIEVGSAFTARVTGSPFDGKYAGIDMNTRRASKEIFISYISQDPNAIHISQDKITSPRIFFKSVNTYFSNIFTRNLEGNTGEFSSAILLGNDDLLSDEIIRNFSRTGTSHILALSGQHMTIIMGLFLFILQRLGTGRKFTAVFLTLCALLYLFLTGASLSAARAVIMLICIYIGDIMFQKSDPLTSLSIAGVIILLISPYAILDTGFWMSFCATMGLLVYMPPLNSFMNKLTARCKRFKLPLKLLSKTVLLFTAGFFAMIPLVIVCGIFVKEISLFSAIASAVLAIPTTVIILFSLLYLPLHAVPFISDAIEYVLDLSIDFMLSYCDKTAGYGNITVSVNYPFANIAMAIIGAVLLISWVVKIKSKLLSLAPFVLSVMLFAMSIVIYDATLVNTVKTTYINSSSRADMMVVSNNKEAIICDMGNGSYSSYNKALNAVFDARATDIKAIMLTRYTHRHLSTLSGVFSSEFVEELWLPYPKDESEYYKFAAISSLAKEKGVKVYMYKDGESMSAFDMVHMTASRSYIDRSVTPISVITIAGRYDSLTYLASGFNETEFSRKVSSALSKSDYLIFGNSGPVTKSYFSLPEGSSPRAVIFPDRLRIAYYTGNGVFGTSYIFSQDTCDIEFKK